MQWTRRKHDPFAVSHLRQKLGLGRVCAELLALRGFSDPKQAEAFLNPSLRQIEDPYLLTDLLPAVDRLIEAMRADHSVAIVGDYDVDGVTSTTLLVSVLRRFGLGPRHYVPRRQEEGYGLSEGLLKRVLADGAPDLLVALDCGTNSAREVAYLREQSIDVIIVDHHRSRETLPKDCHLINPHVRDPEAVSWKHLCTVGLVFKLVHGLVKRLREISDPVAQNTRMRDLLDLVAIGTVADLVPLCLENRILTYHGLKQVSRTPRQGLNALFRVSGLELGQDIQPTDIAYRLGPRINASGRLADASLPVDMLLSSDYAYCRKCAEQLEAMNRQRQAIERGMVEAAEACIRQWDPLPAGIVVFDEAWHPGVVGIVAGKLARDLRRPVIILAQDGDVAVGSGRSVPGINIQKALARCDDLLSEWGGHPMAVGMSVPAKNIAAFTKAFSRHVEDLYGTEAPTIERVLDSWLKPEELTPQLLEEVNQLRPFGEGNPAPLFGIGGIQLRSEPVVFGQGKHCRFSLPIPEGPPVAGIAWGRAGHMPQVGQPVDLAVKFAWRTWNGNAYPQVELIDWRPAQSTPMPFAAEAAL
jgi:single-stranded-DNA-specific exonuclease